MPLRLIRLSLELVFIYSELYILYIKQESQRKCEKKIPPEIMSHCEKSKTNPYHYPNHRFCLHFEALFH